MSETLSRDAETWAHDVHSSTNPLDNARKIKDIRDERSLYATLYRNTVGVGPVVAGVVRKARGGMDRYRVFAPGSAAGARRPAGSEVGVAIKIDSHGQWDVYGPEDHAGTAAFLGRASSLSVACDVLTNGARVAETDRTRLSGRASGRWYPASPGIRPRSTP
jgi:hypothetical protein